VPTHPSHHVSSLAFRISCLSWISSLGFRISYVEAKRRSRREFTRRRRACGGQNEPNSPPSPPNLRTISTKRTQFPFTRCPTAPRFCRNEPNLPSNYLLSAIYYLLFLTKRTQFPTANIQSTIYNLQSTIQSTIYNLQYTALASRGQICIIRRECCAVNRPRSKTVVSGRPMCLPDRSP